MQFQNLCTITGRVKSDDQLVDWAYLIFNRYGVFTDFLIKWNAKSQDDKTFTNMKEHMRDVYHALNDVGKLKIKDSTINMMEKLTQHQDRLAKELGEKLSTTLQANLVSALEHL